MKILIVAGGGGHFTPALAVIQQSPRTWEILIVGRKYGFEGENALSLEYQISQQYNLHFQELKTGKLQRKFTRYTIPSLLKIPTGIVQAISILRSYKPAVVLSFGGYLGLPVTLAAKLLHIPVIIHEQTREVGMANKIASYFAKKICISWESSRSFFPKDKTILTGNPVRNEVINPNKMSELLPKEKNIPIIYVTGGSLGSHAINQLIGNSIEKLCTEYRIIHQTGDAQKFHDFENLQRIKETLGKYKDRYIVTKFVTPDDVGSLLHSVSLVISRSGMSTITELYTVGVPALLIPLSTSQHDEQRKNAQFLKSVGLAEILEQDTADRDTFEALIHKMIDSRETYKKNTNDSTDAVHTSAAQKIIAIVSEIGSGNQLESITP